MAVNLKLSKEKILARWNSRGDEFVIPEIDELDTMAYYNEEYLKNNGWEQRNGIGFYYNDKYKTDRFTYWIDLNAVIYTCYRYDNIEKENIEVTGSDERTGKHNRFEDIIDFISWLDTAIGYEEEYCIHMKVLKIELEEIPGRIQDCVESYKGYKSDDPYDSYYRQVYGACLKLYIDTANRYGVKYIESDEIKEIYDRYKDIKETE